MLLVIHASPPFGLVHVSVLVLAIVQRWKQAGFPKPCSMQISAHHSSTFLSLSRDKRTVNAHANGTMSVHSPKSTSLCSVTQ